MVPASRSAGPLESKASALDRQAKAEALGKWKMGSGLDLWREE